MTRPNKIWEFFSRRRSTALCFTCEKEISLGHFLPKNQTTSNIKRHLRKCHENEWELYIQSVDVSDIAKRRKLKETSEVPEAELGDARPKLIKISRQPEGFNEERQQTTSSHIDYPDLYEEQIDLDENTKEHGNVNPFTSVGIMASSEAITKLQEKKLQTEIYYMEKKGDLEMKNLTVQHTLMLLKAKKIRLEIGKLQSEAS